MFSRSHISSTNEVQISGLMCVEFLNKFELVVFDQSLRDSPAGDCPRVNAHPTVELSSCEQLALAVTRCCICPTHHYGTSSIGKQGHCFLSLKLRYLLIA